MDAIDFEFGVQMRRVNNLQDVQVVLNQLLDQQAAAASAAQNAHGYQIKNGGDATDPQDFVTLSQLRKAIPSITKKKIIAAASGVVFYQRTILIKNTATGKDIADHVTCYGPIPGVTHSILRVTGVLRKTITAALNLQINNVFKGTKVVVGNFVIPPTTTVDAPIIYTKFTTAQLQDLSILTWDIVASDGSADIAGVASYTIEWQP